MTDRLAMRVNGRLYAAGLLLRELEQVARTPGAALEHALSDAVVLQLMAGYRLYLREIAAAYRYRGSCDNAAALRAGLIREGRDSAEVTVLCDAEQRGGLAGLAPAWQVAIGETAEAPESATMVASTGAGRADAASCRGWLELLRELIEAQREQLREW